MLSGIGKSFFGYYLAYRVRQAFPDAVIITQNPLTKICYHKPDGTGSQVEIKHLTNLLLHDSNCWYIVDTEEPELLCAGRTVYITSPKSPMNKQIEKVECDRRYMPIWSLEELKKWNGMLIGRDQMEGDDLEKKYHFWGGVPRTLKKLHKEADTEQWLITMINSADHETLLKMEHTAAYGEFVSKGITGKIIHILPNEDLQCPRLALATPQMRNYCEARLQEKVLHIHNLRLAAFDKGSEKGYDLRMVCTRY